MFRVYPLLDNLNFYYAVNNLTLQGQNNSSRGEVTIEQATLTVFGNIRQNAGGLRGTVTLAPGVRNPSKNSTIVLAGANQIITGRLGVPDVVVAGSGVKSVTSTLAPGNTISFQPADAQKGVIIQSAFEDPNSGSLEPVFDTTLQSLIDLGSSAIINQESGYAETKTSYIKGVLRADQKVSNGVKAPFGNIGLDVTANFNSIPSLIIFRIVGDPLQSPTSTNGIVAKPVKRQYIVDNALDSENPSFAGAALSVVFHYLDSEDELNGIPEENLTMFRSRDNGPPYTPVFGTLNAGNNTVTRLDLPSLTRFTLTLGDKKNPLPVTLIAFDAKRFGADAVLTWTTATEKNNKGFNVQVSTDGKSFRNLGFVASLNANASSAQSYRFVDAEASKSGIRYYRLHQVDLDGKDAILPVRAVNFESNTHATAAALLAYPNPFTDNLSVSVVGSGVAVLRLSDLAGRVIQTQQVQLDGTASTLSFKSLDGLRAGIYIVQLTMPSGKVQSFKVQKQ